MCDDDTNDYGLPLRENLSVFRGDSLGIYLVFSIDVSVPTADVKLTITNPATDQVMMTFDKGSGATVNMTLEPGKSVVMFEPLSLAVCDQILALDGNKANYTIAVMLPDWRQTFMAGTLEVSA